MTKRIVDSFDIGNLFRSSATITFVLQIISVIVMIGALVAYGIGGLIPSLDIDLQILLLLVGSVVTLLVFLAALSVFVRFSRRIGDAVVGHGVREVPMDTPRVKTVVYTYALLVTLMAMTGVYVWYLVDKNYLIPFAGTSISLRIFGVAMGVFFIALLVQIIIAGVGRSATKIVLEVLDKDDSAFED
ncbi:MAG: hypothetical protein HXY34_12210 [Candidatus Thorarchaeota archaeon]|nr:hypothetical protein [Candidatus Thorarchaeota archaeon]